MKKTIKENYRLEVVPSVWPTTNPKHDDYVSALRDVGDSIKRHVDDVESISEEWDTREVCEFCGSDWEIWEEEDEEEEGGYKKGMPVCCGKAQKEFEANRGKRDDKMP